MASLTAPAEATTEAERSYLDHGAPLWRRVLLTREMAIIALLLAVIVVASAAFIAMSVFVAKPGSNYRYSALFLVPIVWALYFLRRRLHLHRYHHPRPRTPTPLSAPTDAHGDHLLRSLLHR